MRLRFPSWLPPLIVLLAAVGLRAVDPGVIESLRLATYDEYQRLRPATWTDARVRIVDIDDESLARVGQWPWPRTKVAELLGRMGEMGAAVVAFDVVFAEEDRTSPRRVISLWAGLADESTLNELAARLPDHDEVFAEVLRQVPSVVGFPMLDVPTARLPAVKWGMNILGDDPKPFLASMANPGARANLPAIEAAAAGQGTFVADPDRDGIMRRVAMLGMIVPREGPPVIYPTLALEALRVVQGARGYDVRSSNASGQTAFGAQTGINAVRVGQAVAPTDGKGRLWLRDTGPVPQRVVPAWKVLAGEAGEDALDGAIVYVGTSAPGLKDIRSTPLNPVAAGVELHARATEQILLGEFLDRPDWATGAEILWLLALGTTLMLLLPRLGPIWCAVIGGVPMASSLVFSWFAFDRWGLLLDPIFPALAALALYIVGSLESFLRTEAERRQVRGAFSRYLSPDLVAQLAADPSRLKLGGETRDMTIMFSDIRGFTSRSEKLTAEQLTRFINRFLTPMTTVIHDCRGTVDKYMGDAVMAFWNAPLDDAEHARHSAEAALGMLAALKALNAEMEAEAGAAGAPFDPIAIGVGLNSGSCSVGNLGSDQHFNYSVIGDDVNLASRLEGRSKVYGVQIVLGENTIQRLGEGWAVIEIDRVKVKGKAKPVTIFTLLGDSAVAAEPWFVQLAGLHATMLEAYRAQDWSAATATILRARAAAAGRLDGLYELYRERIAAFREKPPPEGWDGVEIATEK